MDVTSLLWGSPDPANDRPNLRFANGWCSPVRIIPLGMSVSGHMMEAPDTGGHGLR